MRAKKRPTQLRLRGPVPAIGWHSNRGRLPHMARPLRQLMILLTTLLLLQSCTPSEPNALAVDDDSDGYSEFEGDCNDSDVNIGPGATEVCDNIDNDCDSFVDEEDTGLDESTLRTWFHDNDNDGYGAASEWLEACAQPAGYVNQAHDCDDSRPDVHPGATETCDGVDNDCDGAPGVTEADDDGDGYRICEGDCDDANASIHPAMEEIPGDGIDQDCDGFDLCYTDNDGDGFGGDTTDTEPMSSCDAADGLSAVGGDCNDGDEFINPDATEICSGVDNDCNGTADDGVNLDDCTLFYQDQDGDGFGGTAACLCAAAPPFESTEGGDCYDGSANAYPGQPVFFAGHRGDGSFDYDCDGVEEAKFTQTASSCGLCDYFQGGSTGMWADYNAAACGQSASWCPNCDFQTSHTCQCLIINGTAFTTKTQRCR